MAKNMMLNLDELKVQSYVVALSETEKNFIKGGGNDTSAPYDLDTTMIETDESMDSETE